MIDAVVVLANLMDAQGRLNDESARRAAKAATLFRACGAAVLVTTGWAYRPDSPLPIADAFRQHLIRHHAIPAERIVADPNARDTVGDAYFTKIGLARPRGWKHVMVVTSDYHVARSQEIFNFIYGPGFTIEAVGAEIAKDGASDTIAVAASEQASLDAFRRTFAGITPGDDDAIGERLRRCHPFYNGDIHPRL